MSSVIIAGDVSGSVTLQAPSVAGTTTLTLPATSATIATNVNGDLYPLVSGTAVASTSGTSITFTGIPSWVKRITVMFNGVSTNGTSNIIFQLGSGSPQTTGYTGICVYAASTGGTGGGTATTGIPVFNNSATYNQNGIVVFTNINSNNWVAAGTYGNTVSTVLTSNSAGNVSLSGTLDRIRITTVNGTDTFDAGSINILYE